MTMTRRRFLKLAGASAAIVAGCEGPLDRIVGSAPSGAMIARGFQALRASRWAMAIDMRRFAGEAHIRRVIDACHRAHNVPLIDSEMHEVKWIWTDSFARAFPGTQSALVPERIAGAPFLLMCNHCANPPCVRVCPTKATFRREDGIVMMDFHRCIGCRFCMAGCPYGSRSFNFWDPRPYIPAAKPGYPTRTKGVVEKCDFCAERLADGRLPVCVEESDGAMVFGDLEDPASPVRRLLAESYAIRRKPQLGTDPSVFYVVG